MATILFLAILLFANARQKKPDNATILYGVGLLSGFISGIAGVGGKVVLNCVISLGRTAIVRRASLVMYLFLS